MTEKWEKPTRKHLENYNFQKTITKFYLLYLFKGINLNSLNIQGIEIFINEDNHFRNPKDILDRFSQSNLDINIFNDILSSNIYLRDINIKYLNKEDKDILSDVLTKELDRITNLIKKNNESYNKHRKETIKSLKIAKNIFDKFAYFYVLSPDIIENIINKTKNNHLKLKIKKLEKLNNKIKTDNF